MPTTITLRPWPDPVVDTVGFDPRSAYVERFWLPTLGPTAVLLLRRVADLLDVAPEGAEVVVRHLSRELGLGERDGTSSPLVRTLGRLEQFDLACSDEGVHYVRRHLPPVDRRHVRRLPPTLVAEHERWVSVELEQPAVDVARRRARRLALTLLEAGDEPDTVERALARIGYPPAVGDEAVRWATEQHREVLAACAGPRGA